MNDIWNTKLPQLFKYFENSTEQLDSKNDNVWIDVFISIRNYYNYPI